MKRRKEADAAAEKRRGLHKRSGLRFAKRLYLRMAVLLALGVAVLALILLLGGGPGGGPGGTGSPQTQSAAPVMAPVATAPPTACETEAVDSETDTASETDAIASVVEGAPEEAGVVRVNGTDIYFEGEETDLDALRQALLTRAADGPVILEDDRAIKAAYDSVKGLLEELAISFTQR